jgi:hypothetical protein
MQFATTWQGNRGRDSSGLEGGGGDFKWNGTRYQAFLVAGIADIRDTNYGDSMEQSPKPLTVAQLLKKFPASYVTRTEADKCNPHATSSRSILILSSHLV